MNLMQRFVWMHLSPPYKLRSFRRRSPERVQLDVFEHNLGAQWEPIHITPRGSRMSRFPWKYSYWRFSLKSLPIHIFVWIHVPPTFTLRRICIQIYQTWYNETGLSWKYVGFISGVQWKYIHMTDWYLGSMKYAMEIFGLKFTFQYIFLRFRKSVHYLAPYLLGVRNWLDSLLT